MLEVNGVILTVFTACDEVFLPGIWKYPISDLIHCPCHNCNLNRSQHSSLQFNLFNLKLKLRLNIASRSASSKLTKYNDSTEHSVVVV